MLSGWEKDSRQRQNGKSLLMEEKEESLYPTGDEIERSQSEFLQLRYDAHYELPS